MRGTLALLRLALPLALVLCALAVAASDGRSDGLAATTPFRVTLSGTVNATSGMGYEHLTLPPTSGSSSSVPAPLPSFAAGAVLTLTSSATSECNFAVCVTRLLRPVANAQEWAVGADAAGITGRSDVCDGYFNLTAGASSPHAAPMRLAPGITHISVAARPAPAKLHVAKGRVKRSAASVGAELLCAFSIELAGDACADGTFGPECVAPQSTSASQPAATQTLPADPSTSVALFEVHPNDIYSAALSVNVSSSHGEVTVFVHEGDAPSLSGVPIDPRNDFNVTSGDAPFQLSLPAYRVQQPDRRYFLGVTRTSGQAEGAVNTDVSVSVSERICPPGYHGLACEFHVPFILDPFELARTSIASIPSSAFMWNAAKTEIWLYYGLIFLSNPQASNFSVGLQALDGQPLPALYLRMGQIPTLSAYDMKSSVGENGVLHWYSSGPTALHDAVWYLGVNVPITHSRMGAVALWINTPCPGTTSTVRKDGTTVVTQCGGHGTCNADTHRCVCEGRYAGFDCSAVDSTMGLSSGSRALIIVCCVVGTLLFGYGLCWWFSKGMERRSPMAHAGYGHQLDEGGPPGPGRRGGAGGAAPGSVNRPPMGRI